MIQNGQWIMLPTSLVLNDPNLHLSPIGIVPQRDWRPRMISDYTFFFVNEDTVAIALGECMQFGCALWRVIQQVKHVNLKMGPIYLSKIDIADGFYQIWV
jgi:hypothetical protein